MSRLDDIVRLYAALDTLEQLVGGRRRLASCTARTGWPMRGVYFFFEDGEERSDTGAGSRVVRVGTHAVSRGSGATLWERLAAHRGTMAGGGNHRGSVFRLLIGQALGNRAGDLPPSWAMHSSLGAAAKALNTTREELTLAEASLEQQVSAKIGNMFVLWLEVDDEPSADSMRGYIERNAIALLSNHGRPNLDPPSDNWLGLHSPRPLIWQSGLWNQNHVEQEYDPGFLEVLEKQCCC